MASIPDWTEESLSSHYSDGNGIDLSWLDKPTRHQFRWRSLKGPWITSRRRIASGNALVKSFDSMPTDVYVSTSAWLDPVNLPRLKDTKRPSPILIDHLVVFDIDMRPFCLSRLESARMATLELRDWILEHTDLEIQHTSFSGSKGFHLIAKDPDRSVFQEPDPALREQSVRDHRKNLLDRIIEAGHPVDPVVTADTRRIIRLPGTVHGSTGWICTVLKDGWLERPVKEWIDEIPRHESALRIPKRPPIRLPKISFKKKSKSKSRVVEQDKEEFVSIEVSSHVPGTKDRSALVAWLPDRWGEIREAVERAQEEFDAIDLGPVAYMHDGYRVLAIIPRAMPRDFLLSRMGKIGLRIFENDLRRFEHSWVRISGRMSQEDWESELEPVTVLGYGASEKCMHPWSAPHLELCGRLGLPIRQGVGDIAGDSEPSFRVAVRR